jgi:hypothetical protein
MPSKMKKYTLQNIFYRYSLVLLPLFLAQNAKAQTKQSWFRQAYGVAFSTVYDDGHSFVQHHGTGLQIHIGSEKDRPKSYSQFDNALMWTPLSTKGVDAKYATSAQQGNVRIGYTYLRKLSKTPIEALKFAVGGSAYLDVNARIYSALSNNIFGWDANLGLNVVGRAERDFQFKNRSFSISYQLGLPLLTYNHSPNYLGFFPISSGFEDKGGQSIDWFSLGRLVAGINGNYFYLNQQINLDKINDNGNRIRLSYDWRYANNGFATHRYQNILSGFTFGILTNFSKKTTPKM